MDNIDNILLFLQKRDSALIAGFAYGFLPIIIINYKKEKDVYCIPLLYGLFSSIFTYYTFILTPNSIKPLIPLTFFILTILSSFKSIKNK